MAVDQALATVREAPFIVDVFRAADDLALAAARNGGRRAALRLARAARDGDDELTAVAAVHALGRVFDDEADAVLSDLLSHERAFLREHAAWTLGARLPRLDAIGRLVAVVTAGGFTGMLAQRTLAQWARSASDHVALALAGALAVEQDAGARAVLAETLGLVPGDLAAGALVRLAADAAEPHEVRRAAVAALGERPRPAAVDLVRTLMRAGGELGAVARLAAVDLGITALPGRGVPAGGLTVAQLFLHADIDPALSRSGMGDNGGVATLLLRLGTALSAVPQVDRVLTLSRGSAQASADALTGVDDEQLHAAGPGHLLSPVPLLRGDTGSARAWPARVAAERAVRRALLAHGPVDVLHLRMADVGSMAAESVARELGIPVVFTLAPDPHATIHALDMTGALTRSGFGAADEREHYWFRARLVQRLAANAAHNILFPRPDLRHDLRELLGIEIAAEPYRYTVVPEGIDLEVTRAARADLLAADAAPAPALLDLDELVAALPPHRQGLPLALSVGRLHPVKGMARVVAAWAGDPDLRARCNLVVVGGDLADPSPDEQGELDRIGLVTAAVPEAVDGLVLAGHRPNDVVARWLAAAVLGLGDRVAPGGVYVCGSQKEEFGLAVVEAMAAGLVVVAPRGGGPATYVEQGVTGVLVDTRDAGPIGAGMQVALDLAAGRTVDRSGDPVPRAISEHFTVQAMARTLADVYAGVTEPVAG